MLLRKEDIEKMLALSAGESRTVVLRTEELPVTVARKPESIEINGERVSLPTKKIKPDFFYLIQDGALEKLAIFSEDTGYYYKLIPTDDWPSFSISSVPMHSVKYMSPKEDTNKKIDLIKPRGMVLDTCMGLGYTAIGAWRQGCRVITFERDENVETLAGYNPFSRDLFNNKEIEVHVGSVVEGVRSFGESSFDCIIHDPPTFKLSPELYSLEFYNSMLRLLKRGGIFYHYLPRYKVCRGYDFQAKIRKDCLAAGFKLLEYLPEKETLLCSR